MNHIERSHIHICGSRRPEPVFTPTETQRIYRYNRNLLQLDGIRRYRVAMLGQRQRLLLGSTGKRQILRPYVVDH